MKNLKQSWNKVIVSEMFDEREDFMVKLFGIKTASEVRYNYFSSSVGNLPAFSASFLSWDVVRLSNFFISGVASEHIIFDGSL